MAALNIDSDTGLPKKFMAAFNPIEIEITSDVLGTGSKAVGTVTFFTANEGDTITLDGVTLTATANPGIGEFLTLAAAGTLGQVAESLRWAINENPNLNYKYKCTHIGTSSFVTIFALKTGTEFNKTITKTGAGIFVTGMIGGTYQYRAQQFENYGAWVDVYMQENGGILPSLFGTTFATTTNAVVVARLNQKFDGRNNVFKFDISNILNSYVDFNKPTFGSSTVLEQDFGVNNYYLQYGEEYSVSGNPYVRRFVVGTTQPYWIGNAAIPFNQNSNLSGYSTTLIDELSNQPRAKSVYRDQIEFFNFFYPLAVDGEKVMIVVDYYFTDGTTQQEFKFPTINLNDRYSYIDVGPNNVDVPFIETSTSKTVEHYDITVYNFTGTFNADIISDGRGTAISETYRYTINEDCQDYQTRFIFLNRLGGWDSAHFIGVTESELSVERNIFNTAQDNDFNYAITVDKNLNINSFDEYTSSSGWIDKEYADWLKELVTSLQVYVIEGNKLREIIVVGQEWGYNDKTKQYSLDLTWKYNFDINNQDNGK